MSDDRDAFVFDTGPLRHFALNGWLGVLKFLAGDKQVLIPESVEVEIREQSASHPELTQILTADWIIVRHDDSFDFLKSFSRYAQRLIVDGYNRGECGVLALGDLHGYELVIDDAVPRQIAKDESIPFTGTLGLLCRAIREQRLTVVMVEELADDLLGTDYRFPFRPGGFRQWAEGQGLI